MLNYSDPKQVTEKRPEIRYPEFRKQWAICEEWFCFAQEKRLELKAAKRRCMDSKCDTRGHRSDQRRIHCLQENFEFLVKLDGSPENEPSQKFLAQFSEIMTLEKSWFDSLEFSYEPTSPFVYPVYKDYTSTFKSKSTDVEAIKQYKQGMRDFGGKFEKLACNAVYQFCTYLAPAYRIQSDLEVDEAEKGLLDLYEFLGLDGNVDPSAGIEEIVQETVRKPSDTSDFKKRMRHSEIVDAESAPTSTDSIEAKLRQEIDKYEKMKINDTNTLDFWYANRERLPILHSIALELLIISASSHNSERVYSICCRIVTKIRRNCNLKFLLDQVRLKVQLNFMERFGITVNTNFTATGVEPEEVLDDHEQQVLNELDGMVAEFDLF